MDKVILRNKPNLIEWLSSDSTNILQHAQANELITTPQYDELMSRTVSRDRVIKLLDFIIGKGENVCRDFLNLLKNDNVNESSPRLIEWIRTVDTSETTNKKNMIVLPHGRSDLPANYYKNFLKINTSQLVQGVKNIAPILDDLDLHDESKANVNAKTTAQDKMRKLLEYMNCESIAKKLFEALMRHEEGLMSELGC